MAEGDVPHIDSFRSEEDLAETSLRRARDDIERTRAVEADAVMKLLSGEIGPGEYIDLVIPPGTDDREAADRAAESARRLNQAIESGHPSTFARTFDLGQPSVAEGVDEPPENQ